MNEPKSFPVSGTMRSFLGYVLIIALLCVFPKNGRVEMAIRLANAIIPLFFFALGGWIFFSFEGIIKWVSRRLRSSEKTGDKNE